jgi:hypothetical protein
VWDRDVWEETCGIETAGRDMWDRDGGKGHVGRGLWEEACGIETAGRDMWEEACGKRHVGRGVWDRDGGKRLVVRLSILCIMK